MTPPISVTGELPERVVVVDSTGGSGLARARKPRTYCYWYSSPPPRPEIDSLQQH